MSTAVVYLTSLVGSPLVDSAGERLGRVRDVVARLDQTDGLPPVTGVRVEIGHRDSFVPVDRIERVEPTAVRTTTTKLNLAQFERRPGEVLLAADILDHSLINVQTARLVTAREVVLECEASVWQVAGVDAGLRLRWRRLLPRALRPGDPPRRQFISWGDLEPFVGHVPSSRLTLSGLRLRRLHPAQIADLVEAASHAEGEEILAAVGQDKELEADVFEELDDEHGPEFLRDRSDADVAAVLARMAPDDAADLLLELEQQRRLPVLGLLPADRAQTLRTLLGHSPSTAGGMMNPDFVAAPAEATVTETVERIRASELGDQQVSSVLVRDADGDLAGTVSLAGLARARGDQRLAELVDPSTPTVTPAADLSDVAMLMADYNLVVIPVVDQSGRPVGIVAVDDILDELVPEDWRRRAGAARD